MFCDIDTKTHQRVELLDVPSVTFVDFGNLILNGFRSPVAALFVVTSG